MTALVFDCDGVLADTERFGHLPAFNATFEQYDLPVRWSEAQYGEKLKIGGGKERMASLFAEPEFVRAAGVPESAEAQAELVAQWHRTKTALFKTLVAQGRIPTRPGITRIICEALGVGWTVAVASTSAEESVRAVLEHAVGPDTARHIPIFAGDVVPAKKPDPAIYLLAARTLGLDPADALVIEDSRNGLLAAVGAGLSCLVTVNSYTRAESFAEAVLVVSELGDPDRPSIEVIDNKTNARPGTMLTLADLRTCAASGAAVATTTPSSERAPGPDEEGDA